MVLSLDTAHVKAHLSEIVGRVAYGRERLIVLRRGKPIAAIVSVEDLHKLEAMDAAGERSESVVVHPIMHAYGGWAHRTDVDELLAEIYADRKAATGREVMW